MNLVFRPKMSKKRNWHSEAMIIRKILVYSDLVALIHAYGVDITRKFENRP